MAENDVIELNFSGVTPLAGRGGQDYLPPNVYKFTITKSELGKSSTNKPMITCDFEVAEGELAGSRIRDQFTIPTGGESKFGLQLFMGFLQRCGMKVEAKHYKTFTVSKLQGKQIYGETGDEVYQGRTRSRVMTWLSPEEAVEARKRYADREDIDEMAEAEAPAAPAANGRTRAAAPSAPAPEDEPEAEAVTAGGDEIDELFD